MLAFVAGTAQAIPLGSEITIYDRNGPDVGEDGETEPGTLSGQHWELEGMFVNGSTLQMVGGYDFAGGEQGWNPGHLFIASSGSALYGDPAYGGTVPEDVQTGSGYEEIQNIFGYDYAVVMDFTANSFDVYGITPDTYVTTSYFEGNESSNPWRVSDPNGSTRETVDNLDPAYTQVATLLGSGTLALLTGLSDADVGFLGGDHNQLELNFSSITWETGQNPVDLLADGALYHYTYQCGNDNLMGKYSVPDGGLTLALFGTALCVLEGVRRKFIR
jgi:hypothetical protein